MIALKVLLNERHWQKYSTFCTEYDKAARTIDPKLVGTWPSRAQLHRWISGELTRMPYPDHCRILEKMFEGWKAADLFGSSYPGQNSHTVKHEMETGETEADDENGRLKHRTGDVVAVFATRHSFATNVRLDELLRGATEIKAAGLSLNLMCQQLSEQYLLDLVTAGTQVRCLFLDPDGDFIASREMEEGHDPQHLSMLTRINMAFLRKVRSKASVDATGGIELAIYDETIRFNLLLIDDRIGVVQPYLPSARGIESPTLLLDSSRATDEPLLPTFASMFEQLWARGVAR